MSDQLGLDVIAKVLDSEPARNLVSPATKEFGLLLGDVANAARFYATHNLESICKKWASNRRLSGKTIDAEDFQRTLPLLAYASVQSDDELQDRWAALLESTVSNPNDMLPSFGQTLAQLSADEARFLDRLLAAISRITEGAPFTGQGPGEMAYDDLLAVYAPRLAREIYLPLFVVAPYKDDRDPALMSRAALVIDDLVRLEIVSLRADAITSGSDNAFDTTVIGWYSLAPYGRHFIRAVNPNGPAS